MCCSLRELVMGIDRYGGEGGLERGLLLTGYVLREELFSLS